LKQASEILGISYRQAKRLKRRFKESGAKGMIHQRRGRPSNHVLTVELRQKVLTIYKSEFFDFCPTFVSEKFSEKGIMINPETLRLWLCSEGLWKRKRKRPAHRERRERRACFGGLVQMDGSHHDWFERRAEKCCLMHMIDDATGVRLAMIFEEETTEAAMQLLWLWIEKYGIPVALYYDRKNVYLTERESTVEEALAGEEPLTAFGRACKKLGIQIITAYSPQAKGRVERNHGVYQDRFVKDMRLRNIRTIEKANELLLNGYTDQLNEKFSIQPASPKDLHRPCGKRRNLHEVFCWEENRKISNDWVVRYKNRWYQIARGHKLQPWPKEKVQVQEWLDGSIHLKYKGQELRIK
jgi:transposase